MPAITFFANTTTVAFIRKQKQNEFDSDARVVARLMREMALEEEKSEARRKEVEKHGLYQRPSAFKRLDADDELFEENLETVVRRGK